MADNSGLKIGVEGKMEFKKALADINLSFKELGSFISGSSLLNVKSSLLINYKLTTPDLAELLIVVAIIAVLVAISIPIFNSQLEKSREAVDAANIRAEYAEMMSDVLTGTATGTYVVNLKQETEDWQGTDLKTGLEENMTLSGTPKKNGTATLAYDSTKTGKAAVTVTFS